MANIDNTYTAKAPFRGLGVIIMLILSQGLYAQETILQNVYARDVQALNGSWNYIIDPFDMGYYDYRLQENPNGFFKNRKAQHKTDLVEYNFDTAPLMLIPSDWNTKNPQLFFYEGSVWFKKDFDYTQKSGNKTFVYFGAINYDAKVYLNGEKIGEHIGGFTPFHFDVSDKIKDGSNFIVIRVNNERKPEGVPTINADWWNYGGITREVLVVYMPEVCIDDYLVQLEKGKYDTLSGWIRLNRQQAGKKIVLEIPELKLKQTLSTDNAGFASFAVKAKLELWTPENPKLYEIYLSIIDSSTNKRASPLVDKIGFRQIETIGKEVRLNGKKIFLKGISIHEEAPFRQGRAWSPDDAKDIVGMGERIGLQFCPFGALSAQRVHGS